MKTAREILVIDDEPVVSLGVKRICASEGLAVDTASSGRDGLGRLADHGYQLVLCDIMMEDMDGFEFLAEAGRDGHRPYVIMMTGYSTWENAVRSLQSGAIDYLPKPFTADELMAVVHRGLSFGTLLCDDAAPPEVPPSAAPPPGPGGGDRAATQTPGPVCLGVSRLFLKMLNGIRSIRFVPVGTEIKQGGSCATIVSADGCPHDVLCPLSGRVLETPADLGVDPAAIERHLAAAGWLCRIKPSPADTASGLPAPGAPATTDFQQGESP